MVWSYSNYKKHVITIVLPAKSDSDLTSCYVYNVITDLESIYQFCINPIHRIGLIHK